MFFQVYGENSFYQFLGFFLVFTGLILLNEFARRTEIGGIFSFMILPIILTIYFIIIYICVSLNQSWALNNDTYVHMNGWFHYAKLYAADIGSAGFVLLKYKWWIGKTNWFKAYPFVIVGINIIIAVISDFESAIKGSRNLRETGSRWWLSSEGIWLYGGWWNVLNGIAGIINVFCMTDWWGVYSSKDRNDMLWPDMTWMFIFSYDIWNFEYTYNCLTTHSWYCGIALLSAPTFANHFWNKGAWIQNRANTLTFWCMFAQIFPKFQDYSVFSVIPSVYKDGFVNKDIHPVKADPTAQGFFAVLSIVSNVFVITTIIQRWIKNNKNPYTHEIFDDSDDYKEAYNRVDLEFEGLPLKDYSEPLLPAN